MPVRVSRNSTVSKLVASAGTGRVKGARLTSMTWKVTSVVTVADDGGIVARFVSVAMTVMVKLLPPC